jgi:uncharacterized OB-fold protein
MTPRPLPRITNETRPFWEGCARGELLIQHCRACDRNQHYPRAFCGNCLSEELEMVRASGRGAVHAVTIVRRAPSPAFESLVPYALAIVSLPEGVQLFTAIGDCPVESIEIGMPVSVAFEPLSADIALPVFRPAAP